MWSLNETKLGEKFITLRDQINEFIPILNNDNISENEIESFFKSFCSNLKIFLKVPLLYIEGNIGAGKSTFLDFFNTFQNHFEIVEEPLFIWTSIVHPQKSHSLAEFYKAIPNDDGWFILKFELLALFTRLLMLCYKVNNSSNARLFISERSIYTDRYF